MVAEDNNETVDPQAVRGRQPGRAYPLLGGVPEGFCPSGVTFVVEGRAA